MSQAFYLKYRPQNWDDVLGQSHVVDTLHHALSAGHIAHAYLFAGPRGTGKTTTARLLAKAVNCLDEDLENRPCGTCEYCLAVNEGRFMDLIEIDAASNTSVEDVRDLRDKINFSPSQGRYRVYIIDEVHMLSTAAFNALLKTLEEPPSHAIFILATTEVHKIPATVLSRCQRHEFRRISVFEIVAQLEEISKEENIIADHDALTLIARQATGAMRDAISLLDQLASTGKEITLQSAQDVLGTATSQAVIDLIQAVIDKNPSAGIELIHNTLDAGTDARQFSRQLVDYLRELLLIHMESTDRIQASSDVKDIMVRQANTFGTSDLLKVIRIFNQSSNQIRSNWNPALPLEMSFVEAINEQSVETVQNSTPIPVLQERSSPSGKLEASQQSQTTTQPQSKPLTSQAKQTKTQKTSEQTSQAWRQFLLEVKKRSAKAYGLLNSCQSHYLQKDELVVNFATEILKEMMESPENIKAAQDAIQEVLKREILIRCKVALIEQEEFPPGADNNGVLASALRDLGGKVINSNKIKD